MVESELDKKRDNLAKNVKSFFSSKGSSDDLKDKRKNLLSDIKNKRHWLIYIVLAAIIWLGSAIRVKNLGLLRDATTGGYVPLALDPHLFLKYAQQIIDTGAILAHDPTRFVPLGTSTVQYVFMSSFIAYLYKFLKFFVPSITLDFVAVIYPVICFAFALLFFFLLTRKLFDWKVGLLATLFLSIVPAFLHRTMAGFADHEALGIMIMFMALYFYVLGWKSKSRKTMLGWGLLAGIFTGLMGLTWGGWKFLILIISIFTLVEFFFDKIKKDDVYYYAIWVVAFVITTTTWIPMFSIKTLLGSFTTSIAFLVLFMLLVDLVFIKLDVLKIKERIEKKFPLSLTSFIISFILGILLLLAILGPTAISHKVGEISDNLLHPLGNDRWQLTVAEQHQPYFTTWMAQFGPSWFGIPLYLLLFMVGSIILFYHLVKKHKQRALFTTIYTLFLIGFTMSRYSPNSTFNGTNPISKTVYLGSLAVFAILAAVFYLVSFYKNKEDYKLILGWDKNIIFVLVWFLIMIIAARGAARLLFIFAPITAMMAGYAVVRISERLSKIKNKAWMYIGAVVLVLVLLSPVGFPSKGVVPVFYEATSTQAQFSGPSYNQQWQAAGQWVRENVPEDAVFGHWWDYGYWVQNGFKRATVLDGANKIKYWNFLMGRNVLTTDNQTQALEYLKSHKTSHFLIVADEIGKYTAYSSIGSDKDYDRYSWMTTFNVNRKATQETRDTTVLVYQGGFLLDKNFVWEDKVYPRQAAGVGAVLVPVQQRVSQEGNKTVNNIAFRQPVMALVLNGQRIDVPMKCLFFNNDMITFDGPGYDGCFRLMPQLGSDGNVQDPIGSGLFVSEKAMNALWVNLYVLNQKNPNFDTSAFESIYSTPQSGVPLASLGGRTIGPIRVWKINYPEGFTVDPEVEKKLIGGNENLPDYFFDVN